jgi:putative ubiquitin-RnfH superfamily antitoxin RatB of RatAB toxin-antitoxin module
MTPCTTFTPSAASTISVETVLQVVGQGLEGAVLPLVHQQHRVRTGTTIRTLLRQAGFSETVAAIESGALGLALHGRRAWLDDVLEDGSRVEAVAPIATDAKAARAQKVAAERARRKSSFGAAR